MPLVLPGLVIGLSLLITWYTLYGMHQGSNTWLRTLVQEFTKPRGSFIRRVVRGVIVHSPLGVVIRFTLRVEQFVRAAMAEWLAANMLPVASFFYGLTVLAVGVAHEIRDLGEGIEAGIKDLTQHWIPTFVSGKTEPINRRAKHGIDVAERARARGIAERAERIHGIDRLHRDETKARNALRHGIEAGIASHVIPRIHSLEHRLSGVLSRDLPRLRTRERALERARAHPDKAWLTRIGAAIWAASIFGLMVKFLVRRFPWLFCRRVDRLGRLVCGLDEDALAALTTILLGTLALEDYQALVRLMANVEREAIDEVRGLLNV